MLSFFEWRSQEGGDVGNMGKIKLQLSYAGLQDLML